MQRWKFTLDFEDNVYLEFQDAMYWICAAKSDYICSSCYFINMGFLIIVSVHTFIGIGTCKIECYSLLP